MKDERTLFNDFKLDPQLTKTIFSFFSVGESARASLANKEFNKLCIDNIKDLTAYFKDLKINLDLAYGQLVANFSLKNVDLDSQAIFDECASFYDAETWDPVYKIIGVNRDDLIEKLNSVLGRIFMVDMNPCQGAVYPQISFIPKNQNDLQKNSLELINKLTALGMVVEQSEILKETLEGKNMLNPTNNP